MDSDSEQEEIPNKMAVENDKSDFKLSPEFNYKCNIGTPDTDFDSSFLRFINFCNFENLVPIYIYWGKT